MPAVNGITSRPCAAAAAGLLLIGLLAPPVAHARCPAASHTVAEVRGTTPQVPIGDAVAVRGIVTGDFRGDDGLRGFFLQSREPTADGLPRAVFVFTPDMVADDGDFGPGSEVLVRGQAAEHRDRPQIGWVDDVQVCAEPGLPAPVELALPAADRDDWHRLEGVKIGIDDPLTVTGNFQLARFGTLDLAIDGRLFRPTQFADTSGADHDARRLLLDDASYARQPRPVPYLDGEGTRRVGSVVPHLTGILTHAFGNWRVHPVAPDELAFAAANPRPEPPSRASGTVRIAGFNVENYFLTLGERGAADESALEHQRSQLGAVVAGLQPDVLGLVEVENDPRAVDDLVGRLGKAAGRGSGFRHFGINGPVGNDAIRTVLAWDPEVVEVLGGPYIDRDEIHHRPPVAGHFRLRDGGPGTLVVAIHHKAKSGCPDSGDIDRGQGCWNELRIEQSRALARFLARKQEQLGTSRVLIVGDVNAYGAEDPVTLLREAGYRDLLKQLPRERRYTYVFRGESGSLDSALATTALITDVVAADTWAINADEPAALHEFTTVGGPWRLSDHDPVIVDLRGGPE